jgi:hypothetical protein
VHFPTDWKNPDGEAPIHFAQLRKSDDKVDLTIAFTQNSRIHGEKAGVIATAEVNRDIELHTNAKSSGERNQRWAFVPQRAWTTYRPPERLPFAVQRVRFGCIILHELGHYFGTPHLPRVNDNDLVGCVMWPRSSAKAAALTIPDVLAFNRIVYLGEARLGKLCEGLEFNPESVKE